MRKTLTKNKKKIIQDDKETIQVEQKWSKKLKDYNVMLKYHLYITFSFASQINH